MCERREEREERKRVNIIKKNIKKRRKQSYGTKKVKIYLQTKDTHLGDAQSTIQFGKHVRKCVKVFGNILRNQDNGGLKQQHKETKMPRKHSRGDTWTIHVNI